MRNKPIERQMKLIQISGPAFRFRVTGETFVDTGPKAPLASETEVEETRAAPYRCQDSITPLITIPRFRSRLIGHSNIGIYSL